MKCLFKNACSNMEIPIRSFPRKVKTRKMSSKNKVVLSAAIAAIVAVALIGAAIFIPGAGIFRTTSQTGTLGVQLTDPPIVPAGVTDVYINYSEMAVHVAGAGNYSGWYQIAPAGEIDLMSVLSTSITLGSSQVKTGTYNALGFNITSATVTVSGQNQSAFISSRHLIVPLVGGVQVGSGASEGILVDLSPTVLAVMNGTQTAYVLIPSAQSLHIPRTVWTQAEHRGDEVKNIQQQTWFENGVRGQISLSKVSLSANLVNVTVTNTGQNSTVVSSLSVYYPLTVLCQQYSGSCASSPYGDALPRAIPVALFGVLSNGTMLQYNYTAAAVAHYDSGSASAGAEVGIGVELEQQGVHLGYVLAPGQSVTFTFKGKVATISPSILNYFPVNIAAPQSLLNAISNINSAQQYYVVARGPFGTFSYYQVTAS